MVDFKFFQKKKKTHIDYFVMLGDVMRSMEELRSDIDNSERVFDDWMNEMDDCILGGIVPNSEVES